MKQTISTSPRDTQRIAANIAKKLRGGEIIALEGDLGAGKTTLAQYLAAGLGVKQNLTSPTFVLMKVYKVKKLKVCKVENLVHVDCYRPDDAQELFYLGLEEYLNKSDTVVIIEWADKIRGFLKKFKKVIWVKIEMNKTKRKFLIK